MQRGGAGEQIERLEHEADFFVPDAGQLVVVHLEDLFKGHGVDTVAELRKLGSIFGLSNPKMYAVSFNVNGFDIPAVDGWSMQCRKRLTRSSVLAMVIDGCRLLASLLAG